MKTERIVTVSKEEIIQIIERKLGTKFTSATLSSKGFKGIENSEVEA